MATNFEPHECCQCSSIHKNLYTRKWSHPQYTIWLKIVFDHKYAWDYEPINILYLFTGQDDESGGSSIFTVVLFPWKLYTDTAKGGV